MIICRTCQSRFDDDATTACDSCGADLTGPNGLRAGAAIKSDWTPDDARPGRPSTDRFDDIVAPVRPLDEIVRPKYPSDEMIDVISPDQSGSAQPESDRRDTVRDVGPPLEPEQAPRKGRRPGEDRDEEQEPETNRPPPQEHAGAPHDRPEPMPSAAPEMPSDGGGGPIGVPPSDSGPVSAGVAPAVPAASFASVGDGDVACPACRRANEEHRRFCRFCGATLPAFVGLADDGDDGPTREPLWRRLIGTTRSGGRDSRTFAQRMRDSGQKKVKYRAKYTLKSRLRAIGYVGGGIAGLLMMVGPLRARAKTLLDPPERIAVAEVILGDLEPVPTFGPELAKDRDPETALVLAWEDEPISFTVELPPDVDANHIEFETGFPNDDLDRGSVFQRPAEIEITAGDSTQTVLLADHEGGQLVELDAPDNVALLTITIVRVHQPDWDTYPRVAIAEIAVVE